MTHRIETTQEVKIVTKIYLPSGDVLTLNNMRNQDAMYLAGLITNDGALKRLREQVAAQAAEIEKLRYSLLDVCTEVESADMLLSHGDTEGALVGVRRAHVAASLGFSLLMRTNDSTQILAEVRRAERERVIAKLLSLCSLDDGGFISTVLAME